MRERTREIDLNFQAKEYASSVPIFDRRERRELPPVEKKDRETERMAHVRAELAAYAAQSDSVSEAGETVRPLALAESFRPSRSDIFEVKSKWFFRKRQATRSKHNVEHLTAAGVWTNVIYRMVPEEQRRTINRTALTWAAAIHDIGRRHDLPETVINPQQHGRLAAEWVKKNWQQLDPSLDTETVDEIAYLVRYHGYTEGAMRRRGLPYTEALKVLQEADLLEFVRIMPGNFISRYIINQVIERMSHLPSTKSLIPLAREFYKLRKEYMKKIDNQYEATLTAAEYLHIVKPHNSV